MAIKVIMLGLIAGAADTLLSSPLSGIPGTIVTVGAVIGALAIIWAKAVRPGINFSRKLAQAADVILDLPDHQEQLREWQQGVDGRLAALEGAHGKRPGHGLAHPPRDLSSEEPA